MERNASVSIFICEARSWIWSYLNCNVHSFTFRFQEELHHPTWTQPVTVASALGSLHMLTSLLACLWHIASNRSITLLGVCILRGQTCSQGVHSQAKHPSQCLANPKWEGKRPAAGQNSWGTAWVWLPLVPWPNSAGIRGRPSPIGLSPMVLSFVCSLHQTTSILHIFPPCCLLLMLLNCMGCPFLSIILPLEHNPGPGTQSDSTVWFQLMNQLMGTSPWSITY